MDGTNQGFAGTSLLRIPQGEVTSLDTPPLDTTVSSFLEIKCACPRTRFPTDPLSCQAANCLSGCSWLSMSRPAGRRRESPRARSSAVSFGGCVRIIARWRQDQRPGRLAWAVSLSSCPQYTAGRHGSAMLEAVPIRLTQTPTMASICSSRPHPTCIFSGG